VDRAEQLFGNDLEKYGCNVVPCHLIICPSRSYAVEETTCFQNYCQQQILAWHQESSSAGLRASMDNLSFYLNISHIAQEAVGRAVDLARPMEKYALWL